jgi:hypothetical protein
MNLRTHLSRSNGYRLLGMYDESILILEDIPLGKDRWPNHEQDDKEQKQENFHTPIQAALRTRVKGSGFVGG